MGDQVLGSLYPPPPAFYKLYDVKFKNLLPPAPPAPVVGQYSCFGTVEDTADALPPLQGQKLCKDNLENSEGVRQY